MDSVSNSDIILFFVPTLIYHMTYAYLHYILDVQSYFSPVMTNWDWEMCDNKWIIDHSFWP